MKSELKKLKILLEHWHNAKHSKNFREWAEKAREFKPEVAGNILW